MTGEWRIRRAERADAGLLALLEQSAFGAASWGEESVKSGLFAANVFGLIAFDELDMPAAFALWRTLGREAEILTIGSAPAMRRRGAARTLLRKILDDAGAHGCVTLFLEVDAGNAPARALYEQFGFEKVGERRGYYRNGADALVLRRDI